MSSSQTLTDRIVRRFDPSPLDLFSAMYFQDAGEYGMSAAVPQFHRYSQKASESNEHYLEISPRGFAKSFRKAYVKPIWDILDDRLASVLILSNAMPEAIKRIKRIKWKLEQGTLRMTYGLRLGPEIGKSWSNELLEFEYKGSLRSIEARGIKGGIRGGRFGLVIIDDPEETKASKSPTMRAEVWDIFLRTIWPTLNPKSRHGKATQIVVIGTPIHRQCMVERIFNNEDDQFEHFHKLRFRAIEDGSLSDITGVKPGNSIWPDRFSTAHLLRLRKEMGERAFQSEYQCNPLVEGNQIWFAEFFQHNRYTELPPKRDLATGTYVDPAKTTKDFKTGSQTGIVTVSRERFANAPLYFVRGARGAYMTPKERAREAVQQALNFDSNWIVVEETTASADNTNSSDVAELIKAEAREAGVDGKFGIKTNRPTEDKASRGEKHVYLGEEERICFPKEVRGGLWQLHEQLMVFPLGDLKDLADAFHGALEHLARCRVHEERDWPEPRPAISKRILDRGVAQTQSWRYRRVY